MHDSSNARENILRAAEQLVVGEGVKNLTIERVARSAGLSRGGVLYHFPSKEALIEGMVVRLVEQFQLALDQAVASDPEPYGRFTRAYARLVLARDQAIAAVIGALFAGLAYDPGLLRPLQERLAQWQAQSEAELEPTTAAIVRLTAHALWTNDLLLKNTFDAEQLRAIVARLEGYTRP
jgi:AcrR family transcriptional regulator